MAAAVAQWVRAVAPQAEGSVFKSLLKTGSYSSTAKSSALGASVTGPWK